MIRIFILALVWILSIVFSVIWSYENPEKVELIKSYFKKKQTVEVKKASSNIQEFTANSFTVEVEKVLDINDKTAFVTHPKNEEFDVKKLTIYTQSGSVIKKLVPKKIDLPNSFTLQRNGGIKTIIYNGQEVFALISAKEKDCFFALLTNIENKRELFKTECLPEKAKNNDFNGLGSSNLHVDGKILFSIGTPEKHASKNSLLAQDKNSKFGKILEIDKNQLNKDQKVEVKVFSMGHRVPQGLTKLRNQIFAVEHGPKGGDELNAIKREANYGWPLASYGTNYMKDNGGDGKSYNVNHKKLNFTEPLFAFVPSVGISSLNTCPKKLISYYDKPCLMATSLYGNNLRKGHSIIIFLLNEQMNKVNSIEKIRLGNLVLRHFVTDTKNKLFYEKEDEIYLSADKKGIFRLKFTNFR